MQRLFHCHTLSIGVCISCNNVALPYFTFGYLPSPRNIKILKIVDGYVIAASVCIYIFPINKSEHWDLTNCYDVQPQKSHVPTSIQQCP